jgi:hypothetical protein
MFVGIFQPFISQQFSVLHSPSPSSIRAFSMGVPYVRAFFVAIIFPACIISVPVEKISAGICWKDFGKRIHLYFTLVLYCLLMLP